jgi:putative membrane protein
MAAKRHLLEVSMTQVGDRNIAISLIAAAGLFAWSPMVASADSTTATQSPTTESTATPPAAPIETRTYVGRAAMGDLFEIESSKLALQKTKDAQIRSFAQMMIRDHTASTSKLTAILKREKADVPSSTLDADHQAQLDALKASSGGSFDTAYVKAQLQGHQDALALYQNYAGSGSDKRLKAFAASTVKVVQMHLDHAQALAKKFDVTG